MTYKVTLKRATGDPLFRWSWEVELPTEYISYGYSMTKIGAKWAINRAIIDDKRKTAFDKNPEKWEVE